MCQPIPGGFAAQPGQNSSARLGQRPGTIKAAYERDNALETIFSLDLAVLIASKVLYWYENRAGLPPV
jgi:hypothetical protein